MQEILESAVRAGGNVLTHYFRSTYTQTTKDTPINIVTQADIESQQIITQTIVSLLKKKGVDESQIGFIGEESLHIDGDHTFIIDPLDGTTNFSVGLSYFCIPIAYAYKGVIQEAVVYDPMQDALFYAAKNKGAYKTQLNKKTPLTVANTPLNKTVIVAHLSANPALRKKQIPLLTSIQNITLGVRYMGAVALDHCNFLDGVFGAVLNSRTYIWDTAASGLIIEEAGGTLVDWEGMPLTYDMSDPTRQYNSLAVHPQNLPVLLQNMKVEAN